MPMDDLLQAVPKLISRIDSLEIDLKQTKLTMGNAIVKLVKKEKSQDDPLDSSVQGLVTPPTTKGKEITRELRARAGLWEKKVSKPLDFQEEADVSTGDIKLSTGDEKLSTGDVKLSNLVIENLVHQIKIKDKEEGKAPWMAGGEGSNSKEHYTNEDWDLIRAKLEANAELSKSMLETEDLYDELLEESRDMEAISAEENEFLKKSRKIDKLVKQLSGSSTKDDEPTKKSGRRKQMARKGMHTSVDKNDSEDSDDVDYGLDGPEDKLEKGFWKCLRIMFEEPLSTDSIWSELGQQKIISWRYYDTCRVHCLNLESMEVYMLSERKYPLSLRILVVDATELTETIGHIQDSRDGEYTFKGKLIVDILNHLHASLEGKRLRVAQDPY
ncbi:hypothetical protein Tco_1485176 [Tanacetum coccineum]